MGQVRVSAERVIDAPAKEIYRYIADYRQHHPRFLPPAFSNFTVEEGGYGAGTVLSFDFTVGNRTQHVRQQVEEPEPSHMIVERTLNQPQVTTFVVRPEGARTHVRIEMVRETRGFRGIVERLLMPRLLLPVFRQELELLEHYAASK